MLRLATKTKLSPDETLKRAVAFFGPGGYGLRVVEQNPTCAFFEGAGGGVDVTTCLEGKQTSVELVSRDWDDQVKDFVLKIR
jgi:hypothetical protein